MFITDLWLEKLLLSCISRQHTPCVCISYRSRIPKKGAGHTYNITASIAAFYGVPFISDIFLFVSFFAEGCIKVFVTYSIRFSRLYCVQKPSEVCSLVGGPVEREQIQGCSYGSYILVSKFLDELTQHSRSNVNTEKYHILDVAALATICLFSG